MNEPERLHVLEALKSALSELSAMEETYDDYVTTGDLLDQIEEAITIVEGWA